MADSLEIPITGPRAADMRKFAIESAAIFFGVDASMIRLKDTTFTPTGRQGEYRADFTAYVVSSTKQEPLPKLPKPVGFIQ